MNYFDCAAILIPRGMLPEPPDAPDANAAYFAAKLWNGAGVVVDKPALLTPSAVAAVGEYFNLNVPASFYANPQDTRNFTCGELLTEQLVSYWRVACEGETSDDPETFGRIPLFEKTQGYPKGEEKCVRKLTMLTREQTGEALGRIAAEYCAYTRPWSYDERGEFEQLAEGGLYDGRFICCADNAAEMLARTRNKRYGEMLDYKDVVKLSINLVGERAELKFSKDERQLLHLAASAARPCPMSKRQAKYFNAIIKKCKAPVKKTDNSASPYAAAQRLVDAGDVVGAAEYLKDKGSLAMRSLRWLLSRADESETGLILAAATENATAISIMQTLWRMSIPDSGARTFAFVSKGRLVWHTETEREVAVRHSRLSDAVRRKVKKYLHARLVLYYSAKEPLGKIYLSPAFRKVFVPVNTSSSGKGIGVAPCGTRIPLKGENVRVFCYWNDAFDIDLSVVLVDDEGKSVEFGWFNYAKKPFGDDLAASGDARGSDGAEYIDMSCDGLEKRKVRTAVVCVNGYYDDLDRGAIYCGYQDKNDLRTQAWAPDNIAMKVHIVGDSRMFIAFAVDFVTRECVVLNTVLASSRAVVDKGALNAIGLYLSPQPLEEWSMYDLLACRGTLVANPEQADVVFSDFYTAKGGQEVVRSFDISRLISFIR